MTITYTGIGFLDDKTIECIKNRYNDFPYWLELRCNFDASLIREWHNKQRVIEALKSDDEFSEKFRSKFFPKNNYITIYGEEHYTKNGLFIYFGNEYARNLFLTHFKEDVVNENPFTVSF